MCNTKSEIPSNLDHLAGLLQAAGNSLSIETLKSVCARMSGRGHVAILRQPYLEKMTAGEKTIESRLTKNRVAPFGKISEGDIVFLKEAAGPVKAVAIVGLAEFFGTLNPGEVVGLLEERREGLALENDFARSKEGARYATFLHFASLLKIKPFRLLKSSREAWIVLADNEDVAAACLK